MDLDFRQEGPQSWDIVVATDDGIHELRQGGSLLSIDGCSDPAADDDLAGEYPGLYRRFAELIRGGVSEVDVAPFDSTPTSTSVALGGRWSHLWNRGEERGADCAVMIPMTGPVVGSLKSRATGDRRFR